jgi:L-lactate dehydrogenase complex protein LldG
MELEALGGKFIPCRAEEVSQKILDLLLSRHINTILAWETSGLPDQLLTALSAAGIEVKHPSRETLHACIQVQAGLTGVNAAIAETGSLLLLGGPGRALTTSLLPQIHIALLREADIYETLEQVLGIDELNHVSAGVLITGPSRTADIEMTLTIGVHGPGELSVLCIHNR